MSRCAKEVIGSTGRKRQCRNTCSTKYCHLHRKSQTGGAGEVQKYAQISNQLNTALQQICSITSKGRLTAADRARISQLAKSASENAAIANRMEKQMADVVNKLKQNLARMNKQITEAQQALQKVKTNGIDAQFAEQRKKIDDQYRNAVASLNSSREKQILAFNKRTEGMNKKLVDMTNKRNALQTQINNLSGGVNQMRQSSNQVATTMNALNQGQTR